MIREKGRKRKKGYEDPGLVSMLERYASACNSGDFEKWLSLWADDAVRMQPHIPAQFGKAQIRKAVEPLFEHHELIMEIPNTPKTRIHGNLGFTISTYKLTLKRKEDGAILPLESDGKALTVFERDRHSEWKIIYDCFDTNVPAPTE